MNDERKFKREACVKFKLRWLPEDYDPAEEAIQRGSRKSLDSNNRSCRVSFDDDGLPTKIPRSQRPWKCQRCKFSENPPTAQACEACERSRKEAEVPIRSSFEILANFFGFYRTKSRDSRGSMSSRWSRSSRGSIDSVHPDSDEEEENQEPEETEEQLKARLRKEANLRQYSRSAEERERAAQGAISDMFELAEEDEKTRKKRRYREARIAAGKDPDKQDADDLQKALQERKEKAAKGLSAVKQKFRKAVLGTGVALVAFANDMKDAMWKEDAGTLCVYVYVEGGHRARHGGQRESSAGPRARSPGTPRTTRTPAASAPRLPTDRISRLGASGVTERTRRGNA